MRKMLCILICLLTASVLPASSGSSEKVITTYQIGDYTYTLDSSNGVVITGYSGLDIELEIPSSIDGHPVKSIADRAFDTSVPVINVSLPNSIETIGVNPFIGCEKLENIWVAPDHPIFAQIEGMLFNKPEKKLICYPLNKGDYIIPNGVKSIGESAFEFSGVGSIELPDGLKSIGDWAFANCGSFFKITLPEGLESIGVESFKYCNNLTSITLPASIMSIGIGAFDDKIMLTVTRDSYAEKWAKESGIKYQYPDQTDWLKN